ncbi:MAG: helix-turn-helix domain-containing protein [Chloroflexi bacterium]|nr:helix-turn-helix domain-containing protein [Chloroflexota bacterium]
MLKDESPGARRYQDEVPAVARAVRLLERLACDPRPRSLSELARDLEVGPSSLLAILTTLRHAGLVDRDGDGQYFVGSGLVALGNAAACQVRACERFATIADRLVSTVGETALLWMRQGDSFVLAAAREGTQPLRFVPTPGVRLCTSDTALSLLADGVAPLVEEELLPGVWTVGVPLATSVGEHACLALAGPRERLQRPEVQTALLAVVGQDPATTRPPRAVPASREAATSGPIDDDELNAFLAQGLVATLSYVADDGYPATVPLWYAWDGSAFWLTSRPGSEWAEHVLLDPRVSLAVSESAPPLRRVLVRGELTEIADPAGERWREIEAQLAGRYAGFDASREPAAAGRGRLLKLTPGRLIAWRGLLRYPRPTPDPERPGTANWRRLG